MSDTIETKKLYVRCNGCQQAVPNRKLDIDAHKLNCPYDIKLSLPKALERITELEETVKQVDEHIEEIVTADGPADIDSVGDWPDDAEDEGFTSPSASEPVSAAAHVNATSYDADDDTDDDL